LAKPADVRFYFDADVLGLAMVISSLRSDVTFPGDPGGTVHKRERPACTIADPTTRDEVWIPEAASHGWLIVTRDSKIQDHPAEVSAVRAAGARMVALAGKDAVGVWQQLEVLMTQWRRIEACLDAGSPCIFTATRTTFRNVLI
jgi:hypothetical protein